MDGNLEKIKKILKNNIQINNSNKKKEYLNSCTQCVMGVRTYKKSDKNNKDEKKTKIIYKLIIVTGRENI